MSLPKLSFTERSFLAFLEGKSRLGLVEGMSKAQLLAETGASEGSFRTWRDSLVEHGLLHVERTPPGEKKEANTYVLLTRPHLKWVFCEEEVICEGWTDPPGVKYVEDPNEPGCSLMLEEATERGTRVTLYYQPLPGFDLATAREAQQTLARNLFEHEFIAFDWVHPAMAR